jgi:hypothetical protein
MIPIDMNLNGASPLLPNIVSKVCPMLCILRTKKPPVLYRWFQFMFVLIKPN